MKKMYLATFVLIATILVAIPSVARANLLSNAGFESEGADWANWGDSNYVTDQAYQGSYSAHAWTWNNSDGKFEQTVSVTPGVEYKLSTYLKATEITDGSAWIQFQWDGAGTAIESSKLTSVADWTLYETPSVIAPAGVSEAKIALILEAPANQLANDVFFDEASFAAVPEPNSLLLLFLGITGLFAISRIKN